MLKQLLQHGDIGDLRSLLSPSFFDVMSTRDILRTGRALYGNYRDRRGFEELQRTVGALAATHDLPLVLTDDTNDAIAAMPDVVLRLYFLQLFGSESAILDLRSARFTQRGEVLEWAPAPVYYEWSPDFRAKICTLYESFYLGDEADFERATDALGLEGAGHLFQEHFGSGDQRAVQFRIADFTATFSKVFRHCASEGIALQPDFGPLGAYLASLYEHLEACGGTHDVRAAALWAIDACLD